MLDLAVALFGVVVLAAISPIIALLIKLDSPGPVIFAQTRVGRGERLFQCYKFRTMHVGTREGPTHEMKQRDVTRLGHVLRLTKLDELPQFWNVIRGEMSLVGPRPCLPSQTELIALRRDRGVTSCLPGITGLAQVMGIDMSNPERLSETDAAYGKNQTLSLDLRILWATVFGGGLRLA